MLTLDDSTFLLALGRATQDDGAWPQALALLRDQHRAGAAWLLTPQGGRGTAPVPPRPACFDALRPDRAYGPDELADRAGPFDPDFRAGDTRVVASRDGPAWLWLSGPRARFVAADSARLTALMPHIAQAAQASASRAATRLAVDAARAMQARAGIGRLDLSAPQPVPDPVAVRLLAGLGGMPDVPPPGRLSAPGAGLSLYTLPDGQAALLRRTAELPSAARLADALGLTRPQARLARALATGDTITQAAARMGVTPETARFYSRQVYAATGLRGQAALVRHIWTSALAFA